MMCVIGKVNVSYLSGSVSGISLPVQLLLCRNLWPIFLVTVIIVTPVVAYAC